MDAVQVIVLALVQGLTEFLPISSSAHLILVPVLADWPDQGLAFDVAVHVGTLAAVVGYFRHEIASISVDWARSIARGRTVGDSRLGWYIGLGTIPVGLAGIVTVAIDADVLRTPLVIAATTVGFGLLLAWADRGGGGERTERELRLRDILVIGGAQALAIVPGVSRSGITMTAALLLGATRAGAARISFLLSIPVIVLAGSVQAVKVLGSAPGEVGLVALASGAVLSGLAAYVSIDWFLRLVERIGLMPFVLYRLALGAMLVGLYY